MPDLDLRFARWRRLGRLLPREVRERVFEPEFGDLVHHRLTRRARSRVPFGLLALGTLLGCAPIAIPRLFVRRGRMTRLGRVTAWSAAVLGSLALAWVNVMKDYYR